MMKIMSKINATYLGKPEQNMGIVLFLQAPSKRKF